MCFKHHHLLYIAGWAAECSENTITELSLQSCRSWDSHTASPLPAQPSQPEVEPTAKKRRSSVGCLAEEQASRPAFFDLTEAENAVRGVTVREKQQKQQQKQDEKHEGKEQVGLPPLVEVQEQCDADPSEHRQQLSEGNRASDDVPEGRGEGGGASRATEEEQNQQGSGFGCSNGSAEQGQGEQGQQATDQDAAASETKNAAVLQNRPQMLADVQQQILGIRSALCQELLLPCPVPLEARSDDEQATHPAEPSPLPVHAVRAMKLLLG